MCSSVLVSCMNFRSYTEWKETHKINYESVHNSNNVHAIVATYVVSTSSIIIHCMVKSNNSGKGQSKF